MAKVLVALIALLLGVGFAEIQRKKYCKDPAESGPCSGYFQRYYYNETTRRCESFIYGGCLGNFNRFPTSYECEEFCEAEIPVTPERCLDDPDVERCTRLFIPRYFFDADTGICQLFLYGGCDTNTNNFKTIEECELACRPVLSSELPMN